MRNIDKYVPMLIDDIPDHTHFMTCVEETDDVLHFFKCCGRIFVTQQEVIFPIVAVGVPVDCRADRVCTPDVPDLRLRCKKKLEQLKSDAGARRWASTSFTASKDK